jgi:hypothetical protein
MIEIDCTTTKKLLAFADALSKTQSLEKAIDYNDTLNWSAKLQKFLFWENEETRPQATDFDAKNGAHYFQFTDPKTGKRFSVRVKPCA